MHVTELAMLQALNVPNVEPPELPSYFTYSGFGSINFEILYSKIPGNPCPSSSHSVAMSLAAIFKQQKMIKKSEALLQGTLTPGRGHSSMGNTKTQPSSPKRSPLPLVCTPLPLSSANKYDTYHSSRSPDDAEMKHDDGVTPSPIVVNGIRIDMNLATPATKTHRSSLCSSSGDGRSFNDVELGDSGYKQMALTQDSDVSLVPVSLDFTSTSPDGKGWETPTTTSSDDVVAHMLASSKKRKPSSSTGPDFSDSPEEKKLKPMPKGYLELDAGNHERKDKTLLRQNVLDYFLRTTLAEPSHGCNDNERDV